MLIVRWWLKLWRVFHDEGVAVLSTGKLMQNTSLGKVSQVERDDARKLRWQRSRLLRNLSWYNCQSN